MNRKESPIRICPDYDYLYIDEEGCCHSAFGDEIYISEPELGPRFSFMIPGIEEWLMQYVKATDFAETETDADFDWKTWHYEGLCFAKAIWKQLPRCYKLIYEPPYEDRSGTISDTIIDEHTDSLIESFASKASRTPRKPSFEDYVAISAERQAGNVHISFRVGNLEQTVNIPFNRLSGLRTWILDIINGGSSVLKCHISGGMLMFCNQTIGSHPEMGQLWFVSDKSLPPEFYAYVRTAQFVKNLYLTLMKELGFGIYKDIDHYPSGLEKDKLWEPYNLLKSPRIESFITNPQADVSHISPYARAAVNSTFVMFPDYGGCAFWGTMGAGSGDNDILYLGDYEEIFLDLPELVEWLDCYDNDQIESFEDYWKQGWEIARKVRRKLPPNIDLYYMCYDPSKPDEIIDYAYWYPRLIVPEE